MTRKLRVISPVDGNLYLERRFAESGEIEAVLSKAATAQRDWKRVPVAERKAVIGRFATAIDSLKSEITEELAWQMGRPTAHGPGEVTGTIERTRGMNELAELSLADIIPEPQEGFRRYIRREPLGVVFVIPAWNYPFLIAVNSIVPGLLAGNAVVLKHSAQTPLAAERFAEAFNAAGLPKGLFQFLHLTHPDTETVIRDRRVDFVVFTGSVEGGHHIRKVAAERFIGIGLELGGKDSAYVRADANLDFTITNLVNGAFFNAGQSCCSIERIYVHQDIYNRFIDGFAAETLKLRLGNPLDPETSLGPVAKSSVVETIRAHSADAIKKGAKPLIDPLHFPGTRIGDHYLAPQVFIDVNHRMQVMTRESFGPVVGIQRVSDDAEAVELMNDSPYGLTASVWTGDMDSAVEISDRIAAGTCFMNRCDYLDPYLAWTGVKDTGKGCTLSRVGYEQLTRPKSYHLKLSAE